VSDREHYEALQSAMKPLAPLFAAGDPDATVEFIRLWETSEQLKNKHGGMPPEEDLTAIKQPAA
jgi:hypothetical protein